MLSNETIYKTQQELIKKYGEQYIPDIKEGIENVSDIWKDDDGNEAEFNNFCILYYVKPGKERYHLLKKCDEILETWHGHLGEIVTVFTKWQILDIEPLTPFDTLIAKYNPFAHLNEDMFKSKLAFIIQLNFKRSDFLKQRVKGKKWSRINWVKCRLGEVGEERIPPEILAKHWQIMQSAHAYIDNYYINLNNIQKNGKHLFENYSPLSVHWGLRDEIRSLYSAKDSRQNILTKQLAIFNILENVVTGTIPKEVINNNNYIWDIEKKVTDIEGTNRYEFLHKYLQINLELDKYSNYKSILDRSFLHEKEIPQTEVKKLLHELLSYSGLKYLTEFLKNKLNRNLYPFDIWFRDFYPNSVSEDEKDKKVAKLYPNIKVFQNKIPEILIKLGFDKSKAYDIAKYILVEPSRGSGHAAPPPARWSKVRLRTHEGAKKLNWKSFYIGMHELGHNVEQVLSSCFIDWYTLSGVPNIAFTEGFAYVFADRANEIIGCEKPDFDMFVLDRYLQSYEMSGIALYEIELWEWLYQNPSVSIKELKDGAINIANKVWKKYFSPYFGENENGILAVYSHNLLHPLYIPNYSLGYIIAYQIQNYLKNKVLGEEMERMCLLGKMTPQQWMEIAIGAKISARALLDEVSKVLGASQQSLNLR